MMIFKDIIEKKKPGFFIDNLKKDDLNIFKSLVLDHFNYLLAQNKIFNINLENYLDNQEILAHEEIFKKKNRLLPKKAVEKIFNRTFLFKILNKNLKNLTVIDEENIKYPNIYWRLVRPYPFNDTSTLHKDIWYWDLWGHKIDYSKFNRIKIWIALTGSNEKLGFCYVKNSTTKDFNYSSEIRQGKLKPTFKETMVQDSDKISLIGNAGKYIIFREDLLHQGEMLYSKNPRLSCEFTMIYEV